MGTVRDPEKFAGAAVKQELARIADAESVREVFAAGVPVANANRLSEVDTDVRGIDREGPRRGHRRGSGSTKGARGYTSFTPFTSPMAAAFDRAYAEASEVDPNDTSR